MKPCKRIHDHCGRGARLTLAAFGASFWLHGAGAAEPSAGMLPVTGLADYSSPEPEDARSRPPRWLGENWFNSTGITSSPPVATAATTSMPSASRVRWCARRSGRD